MEKAVNNLLRLIQQPGYELKFGEKELILEVPTKGSAYDTLDAHEAELSVDVATLGYRECLIKYPNMPEGKKLSVPATPKRHSLEDFMVILQTEFGQDVEQQLWVSSELALTRPLLDALGIVLDSESAAALTRISDSRQMAVNKRFSKVVPDNPQESVKKTVRNFVVPADLEQIEQATRLYGSEGNTFECRYTAALDDELVDWRGFTVLYRVIQDQTGEIFRLGEVIGLDMAQRPLSVIQNAPNS